MTLGDDISRVQFCTLLFYAISKKEKTEGEGETMSENRNRKMRTSEFGQVALNNKSGEQPDLTFNDYRRD